MAVGHQVPEYVTRQRAAAELCMSDDSFDKYVANGTLPQPKERDGLKRWKWSEIEAAFDGGSAAVVEVEQDAFDRGVARAKGPYPRAT